MNLEAILIGAVLVLVGFMACFSGYRLFRGLGPIWGFLAGFLVTALALQALIGIGALVALIACLAAVLVGQFVAKLAYTLYSTNVLVLVGIFGYLFGASLLGGYLLNIEAHEVFGAPAGLWNLISGVLMGIDLGLLALLLNLPKLLVVLFTALDGALALVVGALLLIGQLSLTNLQHGLVGNLMRTSWWLGGAIAVIALIGITVQLVTTRGYQARVGPRPRTLHQKKPLTSTRSSVA